MTLKPILTLDFDGVVHSYTSGWQGARRVSDAPVPGALEFIVAALNVFRVAIYSSRSHQFLGRFFMKRWLRGHLIAVAGKDFSDTPAWWRDRIAQTAFADPWGDEVRWAADVVVADILWPRCKPSSMVSLDDRAITFTGAWPDLLKLRAFQPWNKR